MVGPQGDLVMSSGGLGERDRRDLSPPGFANSTARAVPARETPTPHRPSRFVRWGMRPLRFTLKVILLSRESHVRKPHSLQADRARQLLAI